jgi:hypothetical protein
MCKQPKKITKHNAANTRRQYNQERFAIFLKKGKANQQKTYNTFYIHQLTMLC